MEWADKTDLVEKLPVHMTNETDEKENVETEYFDQEQTDKLRIGNHMDIPNKNINPWTSKQSLEASANDRACTQAELTIKRPKHLFNLGLMTHELESPQRMDLHNEIFKPHCDQASSTTITTSYSHGISASSKYKATCRSTSTCLTCSKMTILQ